MARINGAVAIGIILFFSILAGFIGARIEQQTLTVLGAVFIGSLITGAAAVAVAFIVVRGRSEGRASGGGYMNEDQARRYALRMWRDDLQAQALAEREAKMLGRGQTFYSEAPAMPEPGTQLAVPQQPAPRRSFFVVGQDGNAKQIGGGDF